MAGRTGQPFARLLAKSSRTPETPREAETLAGHLMDVTAVAVAIAEHWGTAAATSMALPEEATSALRRVLPRAAFLHDLGKANDHFQRMVRSPGQVKQAIRHEVLSVWLLLREPALDAWLFAGCSPDERQAVLVAAAGHHLQLEGLSNLRPAEGSGATAVQVLAGHSDMYAALARGSSQFDGTPPRLSTLAIDLLDSEFSRTMRQWFRESTAWWEQVSAETRRFTALVKALLVATDVAGSAVPRQGEDAATWAVERLSRTCRPEALEDVVAERLNGQPPRPFQRAVAQSEARVTFVRAGCGSGKTAAAYLWAAQWAAGRKLFFCYPTTGTASQGYSDYVPPGRAEAALIHSRSAADLADLLVNGDEGARAWLEALERYESLAAWAAPVTVCTVDTVLGLIQNARRGLFSSAAIVNGAFVFDEIHQYDERLFGALLHFLDAFRGLPALLMTASLPRVRLAALRRVVEASGERLAVVDGPADLERLPRYRLRRCDTDEAWAAMRTAVSSGQQVLWVANTVERARDLAQRAKQEHVPVLPYHSRYRYGDRLERHRDVVNAFAGTTVDGVLAVTTQVCEVSLDLSAQLLVTELAPAPALIQRLGRLNRRATPESAPLPAEALVIASPRAAPYDEAELALAEHWLAMLGEGAVSQADLAAAFEALSEAATAEDPLRSAWLDGGVRSSPAPLREAGTTVPVLREEDLTALDGLLHGERRTRAVRLTLPMPLEAVSREIGGWAREGAALVAPVGRMSYDEQLGGKWQ